MEFTLLGPVEAYDGERRIDLGRRRERGLLAILLLHTGSVIRSERLADLLWDDEPPPSARASLRTHVARLRRRLAPARSRSDDFRLDGRNGGYVLDGNRDHVDVHRFRDAVDQALACTDPALRSAGLRAALALWKGPFLAGAVSDRLRDRIGAEVVQLRLAAIEAAIDADLACGRHYQLVGELTALTAEHPVHERFAVQLMTACHRSGMRAEALRAYEQIRRRLSDSLGLAPGPDVRDVHLSILRRENPPLALATVTATLPAIDVLHHPVSG